MRHLSRLSWILLLAVVAGCSGCVAGRSADEARPAAGEARPTSPPASSGEATEVPAEPADPEVPADLVAVELSTVGWDALTGSPVVLLRGLDSGRVLPIWIGVAEARAIGMALHGIETPRPMTHDLLVNVLGELEAVLEGVVVSDLRDNTYYGLLELRVEGEEEPRLVDTRPSDALALALRTGARISVAAELFEDQPDFQFLPPDADEQVVRVLGMTVTAVGAAERRQLGLPERDGILVAAVDGEAERQGFRAGDFIVALDGAVAAEPIDFLEAIAGNPGGRLEVTVWRDGEEVVLVLVLARRPPRGEAVV